MSSPSKRGTSVESSFTRTLKAPLSCKNSHKDSTLLLGLLLRSIRGDHYKFDLERNSVLMNNIAIIKLEEKVQETDFVSPICLSLGQG